MPIEIEEDYDKTDGGYAIVTLPKSIGGGDGAIRIKRLAGEPDKLGPKGWQAHDATLTPLEVREVGGRSTLYFGPELTQHLLEDTEIEITVPALKSVERVIWPYITPSVHADGGRGSMAGGAQTLESQFDEAPGGGTGGGQLPIGEGDDGPGTDGGHIVDPGPEPIDDELAKPGFNLLWLIPIAAVAAVAVFFLVPLEGGDEEAVVPEQVVDETPDEEPQIAEVDTRDSLMDAARACLQGECDSAAFHDIAQRMLDIGESDVFSVMGLAAERGSLPAMEWLANAYDPLHFEASEGLASPDLVSAFGYYGQAEEAGSQLAGSAKTALCEALAAPGDAEWASLLSDEDIRSAYGGNCQ